MFDGHSIRLYIDGEEVARANYEGAIAADEGFLFFDVSLVVRAIAYNIAGFNL